MGDDGKALLISYDVRSEKFESRYERNTFYRGLFGYKQTVRRNDKVYHYEKPGMLDEVPHIKVEDSVFIVHRRHLQKFRAYFADWGEKVDVDVYKIRLEGEHAGEIGTNHGRE